MRFYHVGGAPGNSSSNVLVCTGDFVPYGCSAWLVKECGSFLLVKIEIISEAKRVKTDCFILLLSVEHPMSLSNTWSSSAHGPGHH